MMKEQVLITQLHISKAGQVKHFQLKLPRSTKRIIGIEIGSRIIKAPSTSSQGNGFEPTR